MPDADFYLAADFSFRSEDSDPVDVHGIVEIIRQRIPGATIDFERGRLKVLENINRLRSLGTPEVIYSGEHQLLDRTIYVEIPVPNRPERLEGFTSGFSYYDGCISLKCRPFNIDSLKVGAVFVADSLDLDVSLVSQDSLEIGILCKQGDEEPHKLVAERYGDLVVVSDSLDVTDEWQSRLESACIAWIRNHPEPRTRDRWLSVIPDGQSLWHSLHNRLLSLGPVQRARVVEFNREFWHSCLILNYVDWTALVNLSGHPRTLLNKR